MSNNQKLISEHQKESNKQDLDGQLTENDISQFDGSDNTVKVIFLLVVNHCVNHQVYSNPKPDLNQNLHQRNRLLWQQSSTKRTLFNTHRNLPIMSKNDIIQMKTLKLKIILLHERFKFRQYLSKMKFLKKVSFHLC